MEHSREIGYRLGEATALHRLGRAALDAGDAGEALLLGHSLRLVRSTGDDEVMAGILDGVASAAAARSDQRWSTFRRGGSAAPSALPVR